jgi:hypothetical protein
VAAFIAGQGVVMAPVSPKAVRIATRRQLRPLVEGLTVHSKCEGPRPERKKEKEAPKDE